MKIALFTIVLFSSFNAFAEEGVQHLRLLGIVLPVSQTKITEGKNLIIESSTNSEKGLESQKLYLTDDKKKKIEIKSKFAVDNSNKYGQKVMINMARDIASSSQEIYLNVVAN